MMPMPPELGSGLEVLAADQTVPALHLAQQQGRCFSAVEARRTVTGNAAQRGGQLRLTEALPLGQRAEVGVEVRPSVEFRRLFPRISDEPLRRKETFLRQFDGRYQQFRPGHRTEALVRGPEAGVADGIALLIEIHVSRGGGRRGLAVVEKGGLAVHVQRHEPATADIAGIRQGHGEHERRRDCRVYRIAAVLEDAGGDGRGVGFRAGDGGVACRCGLRNGQRKKQQAPQHDCRRPACR